MRLGKTDREARIRQGELLHPAIGRRHVAGRLAIDRAEAVILYQGRDSDRIGIAVAIDEDMHVTLETLALARRGLGQFIGHDLTRRR